MKEISFNMPGGKKQVFQLEDVSSHAPTSIAEVTIKFDFADGVLAHAYIDTNPALKCVAETQDWYGFENGVWLPRIDPRQEVAKFLHSLEPTNLDNPKTQERIHQQLYSSKKLRDVLFQLQNHPSLLVTVKQSLTLTRCC
jgi:hypothetical protein